MELSEKLVAQAVQAVVTRPELIAAAVSDYQVGLTTSRQPADNGERAKWEKLTSDIEARRSALMARDDIPAEFLGSALRDLGMRWQEAQNKLAALPAPVIAPEASLPFPSPQAIAAEVSGLLVEAEAILRDDQLPLADRHRVLRGIVEKVIPAEAPASRFDASGIAVRTPQSAASPVSVTVQFRGGLAALMGRSGERVGKVPTLA
jgi:hypothetical protein